MEMINAGARFTGVIRVVVVILLAGSFLSLALGFLGQNRAYAQPNEGYGINSSSSPQSIPLALSAGDVLTRVQCTPGYTAVLYNNNVTTADGLAFGPDGQLYVAEESADQVSQIGPNNVITPVIQNIDQPEGITFDDKGNLYVVEDVPDGRIIKLDTTSGVTSTVAISLNSPEGIVWLDDDSDDGILYVTESTIGDTASISDVTIDDLDINFLNGTASINPNKFRTHVTSVSLDGQVTRILTKTAIFTPASFSVLNLPDSGEGKFWSYTGEIVQGPDGLLYFSNELSEQFFTDTVTIANPFGADVTAVITATSGESIFTINPSLSPPLTETPFAAGLEAPEGLQFSLNGDFPLYVAEEGPLDQTNGRISLVSEDGSHTVLCTGFGNIEDILLDEQDQIYVSEDKLSNTDLTSSIILLKPIDKPIDVPYSSYLPLIVKKK